MRRFIARRTLQRVNEIRVKEGMETLELLPVGEPRKAGSCVIANAFTFCTVNASGIEIRDRRQRFGASRLHEHSKCSRLFIMLFDLGFYPSQSNWSYRSDDPNRRRRLVETRYQTIQRRRAAKKDAATAEVVAQLRTLEEDVHKMRERMEGAEARELDAKKRLQIEREVHERHVERLEGRITNLRQNLKELEHEVVVPEVPEREFAPIA